MSAPRRRDRRTPPSSERGSGRSASEQGRGTARNPRPRPRADGGTGQGVAGTGRARPSSGDRGPREGTRPPAATASGSGPGRPPRPSAVEGPTPRIRLRFGRLGLVAGGAALALGIALGGKALVSALVNGEESAPGRTAPPTPTSAAQIVDCSSANLEIVVELSRTTYTVGDAVPVTVTLTHRGRDCLVDGSDAGRQVVIASGEDRVWSSADCPSSVRTLLMAGDDTDRTVVTWGGGRSAEGCAADLPGVEPGDYTVSAVVPGAEDLTSEVAAFTLVAPPPAPVEDPAEPGEAGAEDAQAPVVDPNAPVDPAADPGSGEQPVSDPNAVPDPGTAP